MDSYELAGMLFGASRSEGAESTPDNRDMTVYGVAKQSEDGSVLVHFTDDVTLPEDDGLEHDSYIELPSEVYVEDGDEVAITLSGGVMSAPRVSGVIGGGDRMNVRIAEIEADYVKASRLEADVADIGFLKADSAVITDMQADTAKVHNLTANQLSAATAYIASLNAGNVTAESLIADVGKVHTLTAAELSAAAAYIAALDASSVTAQRIAAISGSFDTVQANAAKVANLTAQELEADHATIGSLDANYAQVSLANVNNAWIASGVIRDAAISDGMINSVSANKLTAGTIDASNITVTNLNADNITTGTINGQRIGAGSLSLDKLSEDVYTEAEVDDIVDGLNDRIDGAIQTYTGTVVPTLNNSPANEWNTVALKDEHVGDVYYVVNSQSQQSGYCYRFTKSGSTYSWQLIKDSDVTAALSRLTTAEGKITSIESFDSTVSSFMTNTDSELTSVKSRATSLETRMTDAEGDISEKVDTSTFNSLSQTVDGNSASITSMSTVLTNNGLTSSTNITNTVNTVSQTASGNSSKITQLTTTLGTNADGTTKAGDVVHRTSAVEQDLSGFKTTVSQTYATNTTVDGIATRVSTAESNITQNTEDIALRATKTEVQQVRPAYASSSTAAGTAAKVATIDPAVTGYALYKGATVAVTFSTANTAATPTLNLNSTGAKQIRSYTGAALSEAEYKWAAGATIDLVYDGTYWRMQDSGSVKRVTAAEASIRVNADNIESKVSKDGVISSINQSAETVKIQASKVEIDGTAIFTAISSDVDDAITDKGYQTSSQVESAITSKGYATTTQAQGYATTAKSEAISAAATDATTKANAAEMNAKNDTTSRLNAMGSDNKVVNGAFVNGTDNWSAWGTPTTRNRVQVNGKWWMHCVTTATQYQGYSQNHYTSLGVTVEPSATYTVGITARGAAANTKVCVGFHWFAPSGTSIVSQSWLTFTVGTTAARQYQTVTVPSGIDHFNVMVGQSIATAQEFWITDITLVKGAVNQEWSESSALAGQASITANAAAPKASAVKRTQRIWYRKSASGAPATPGTASSNWVTKNDDGNDAWTKMHIAISSTHKYIYTCEQYEMANGTVGYTSVLLDNTITVIDGGNIITGTVTANKLNAADINASKSLTVGAMTDAAASTILNSNMVVGGRNYITGSATMDPAMWRVETHVTVSDGVATLNGTTADWNACLGSSLIDAALFDDDYVRVSFEYKASVDTFVYVDIDGSSLAAGQKNTGIRTKYKTSSYTLAAASEWTRFEWPVIPKVPSDLPSGSGDVLSVYVCIWNRTDNSVLQVRHFKLEKGNKATDWSPAPEDMATAESLAGTNESLEGAIEDIGELSDQLVGTVTEQNRTITDIQTYLNSLRQDLDAEIQSRQQWLNFNSAEGLVIGAAGSTFKTVTTNTSQQFRSGGTVLAETSGTEFVAPVMRSDQLLIGNWMWTRRDNGNLSLKWIG